MIEAGQRNARFVIFTPHFLLLLSVCFVFDFCDDRELTAYRPSTEAFTLLARARNAADEQRNRQLHASVSLALSLRSYQYKIISPVLSNQAWVWVCEREVYWPCAGGLSAVNSIRTHLRDPINSGLTRWRMVV